MNPLFARLGIPADVDTLPGIQRLVDQRAGETRHFDFKRQLHDVDDLADDPKIAVLLAPQAMSSSRKMNATISHWCSSASLNADTRIGLAGFRPEFMPGMRSPY